MKEKKSVQIISRIFINDFESAVRTRYNKVLTFGGEDETENLDDYIEGYLKDYLTIKINGKRADLAYIGKEYDIDIIKCYLEIEDVKKIDTLEITNRILFDLIQEQQNIIKTKINSKQKSVILIPQKDTAVLKFN
ncbi:peptidase E [Flavobacteriaceae bacterium GSB9]|nr:peptidase E [Flavobacteriaceae bacterium GSB9]